MNAFIAEAGDALKPIMPELDPPLTFEEITRSLNADLVKAFQATSLGQEVLEEFVFALDHMLELAKTDNFPNNRLLNTPDIIKAGMPAVCAFNDFARRSHDASQFGVAVGPQTLACIQEFLDYKYLHNIALLFQHLKVHTLELEFDKVKTQLCLNRFSPHPEFGVLTYNNVKDEVCIMIPFHLTRIADVH